LPSQRASCFFERVRLFACDHDAEGFGRFVKVLKPAQLVNWAEDELDAARQQYGPGGVAVDSDVQPPLPFLLPRYTTVT